MIILTIIGVVLSTRAMFAIALAAIVERRSNKRSQELLKVERKNGFLQARTIAFHLDEPERSEWIAKID